MSSALDRLSAQPGGNSLATPVSVTNGGTGAATLTANGVLIGEGTSAVAATSAGTAGQFLGSNGTGVDPTFKFLPAAYTTADFTKTSDTTLANVTGLSVTLAAGKVYTYDVALYTTSASAGGVKASMSGTATATFLIDEFLIIDNGGISAQTRTGALDTAVSITSITSALIKIRGQITVNAGGTLTVQFAQASSNITGSVVLKGSHILVTQLT